MTEQPTTNFLENILAPLDWSPRINHAVFESAAAVAYHYHGKLPSYEEALLDAGKARVLFDASKGGNVRGITEDHRFALAEVFSKSEPANEYVRDDGQFGMGA